MANIIPVPFPHMALNSHNVPPPDYLMFNTWKVAASDPVDHIVGWVRKVAVGMPGGHIETLIFNAHGSPGKIHIGQGINLLDLFKFQDWNTADGPLIKNIWIVACSVAGRQKFVSGGVDGETFLRDMSIATGARVTGAVREQRANQDKIPIGYIDQWEDEVISYKGYTRSIHQAANSSHD